ncbi:NADH-quinone oxidoreductase subunit NuoN [Cytobacillus horneckiae]|uniref:NADH-quinone oxidoreductase subunit N n=1 Tax=Cytobacillus horneckiae TaxID=549687 RepID=A0A2N0ZFW3_9BACI|nr:NADH-quinone oxidoreductase subunit NuoN [Cytobacillus horneckiae]MCM3179192.1 NADH-quinone oxidoreductase subunit NuoN [Cytobacillus horneckiae]MEC1154414.1 NADH-quinone oxidoreductase subunit NuoN [Cytobacillus horneckiae]MED2937749.1 NADH-quinone oxidoreductase subunit NuoN [Cytobacillus horneckiae]PKG28398.1 NADH-quinone oxidoreductase subunit NuoN [Cytobacillus horneckiae]
MDLETLLSYRWSAMTPEFIILGVVAVLSLLDLFLPRSFNRKLLGWLSFASIIAALITVFTLIGDTPVSILYDTFRLDSFAIAFKILLLIGAALAMLLAISYEPEEKLEEYRGEFYYLFLTALLGVMVMSSSGDLITLFVGLELLSISSYILVGMRKNYLPSNESAMKYVINGAIATAITLFGMSYVYGISGTTNIKEMAAALGAIDQQQHLFLLALAFLMIVVGLAFKISAVPFHMWAPDVYEGAPLPVTAFLSVVSKTAGFIIIIRIFIGVFFQVPDLSGNNSLILSLQNYLAVIAGATMLIGNIVALRQSNIKRMLAYSSIAHAGYLLVAVTAFSPFMIETLWFYLGAYLFMTLGVFAIIQVAAWKAKKVQINEFAGLYRSSPFLAVSLAILFLSLAGIPGTSGFIGKLNIFMGALSTEPTHYILASLLIATTVISYIYYFRVLAAVFFRQPQQETKISFSPPAVIVISLCVAVTVILGVFPNIAFDFLHGNFLSFNDFIQ